MKAGPVLLVTSLLILKEESHFDKESKSPHTHSEVPDKIETVTPVNVYNIGKIDRTQFSTLARLVTVDF